MCCEGRYAYIHLWLAYLDLGVLHSTWTRVVGGTTASMRYQLLVAAVSAKTAQPPRR